MMRTRNLLLTALVLGLALFGGCGSDTVAPHDNLPALTEQDSANQAGLVALAVAEVGPLSVTYSTTKTESYTFPPSSDVQGSVELDYRTGGANGTVANPNQADYVHISTLAQDNQPGLMVESPLGGKIYIIADIMANITRGTTDSATILSGSNGQMIAGGYSATFEITGVTVYESGYPVGGPVTFDNGTHVLTFMFDGTAEVRIALNGVDKWTFNLDTLVFHIIT